MVRLNLETKQCPFCAEVIMAKAVKCRFCGEFLNTPKARALEAQTSDEYLDEEFDDNQSEDYEQYDEYEDEELDEDILFSGRPSLLGMIGTIIRSALFAAGGVFFIAYKLEQLTLFNRGRIGEFIGSWRGDLGAAMILIAVLAVILRALQLKMTYYQVSSDRIEFSRGIFDRRVDNIDMFRVLDLKLRRTLLDCLLGIGSVTLITNDQTDPEFEFDKIRNSKKLYNIIKKTSLEADAKRGVVHLE